MKVFGDDEMQAMLATAKTYTLPVTDDSGTCGVGVFAATVEDTKAIMDGDPGVQSGVFVYDVHPCMGFPGDALR